MLIFTYGPAASSIFSVFLWPQTSCSSAQNDKAFRPAGETKTLRCDVFADWAARCRNLLHTAAECEETMVGIIKDSPTGSYLTDQDLTLNNNKRKFNKNAKHLDWKKKKKVRCRTESD